MKLSNVISDLIYEKTVLKYEENGKFGLIDFNGKKIVNNIYENIEGLPNKEDMLDDESMLEEEALSESEEVTEPTQAL